MGLFKEATIVFMILNLSLSLCAQPLLSSPSKANKPISLVPSTLSSRRLPVKRMTRAYAVEKNRGLQEIQVKLENPEDRLVSEILSRSVDAYTDIRMEQDSKATLGTFMGTLVVRICLFDQHLLACKGLYYDSLLLPDFLQDNMHLFNQSALATVAYLFLFTSLNIHIGILPSIKQGPVSEKDIDSLVNLYGTGVLALLGCNVISSTIWSWDPVSLSSQFIGLIGAALSLHGYKMLPTAANSFLAKKAAKVEGFIKDLVEKEIDVIMETTSFQTHERSEVKKYINMETLNSGEVNRFTDALDKLAEKIWNEHYDSILNEMCH